MQDYSLNWTSPHLTVRYSLYGVWLIKKCMLHNPVLQESADNSCRSLLAQTQRWASPSHSNQYRAEALGRLKHCTNVSHTNYAESPTTAGPWSAQHPFKNSLCFFLISKFQNNRKSRGIDKELTVF